MNIPNQLTVIRLILSFVFLATMTFIFPHSKTLSLLIFSIAAFTDFLDGHLARKHNLITSFGKLMDPLADKVLMAAGFIMLIPTGHLPAWVVVLILAREFMVTGLRLVASAEGMVLAAENLGKYKTSTQIATVIYFLLLLAARQSGSLLSFLSPLFDVKILSPSVLGSLLIWGSLILTLLSGFNYMWKNRQLLSDC
ncbi:MAG: CDP-diacylglycerol--glycerol-3-phosphate 3-phosphatidyltransferase [Verrucomicrobiales bacterium]|nr:CDP-diacylglycerol--glycerol-3-phosphate 3-phosphatidyltransferase [Verrucomicrobiales bacterium]